MAIHVSPVFEGFSGSINRQLMFRQRCGKTIVSKFPNRSAVIYSENQKREQRRFADAVSFARIVIGNKALFDKYSVQAVLLGFRSAWNAAIAEYMSAGPLSAKPKKIRFEKSIVTGMGKNIRVNLSKKVKADAEPLFKHLKQLRIKKSKTYPPPADLKVKTASAIHPHIKKKIASPPYPLDLSQLLAP